ncbi:copper resistance CopC family protein [Actinoplanes sp. TFC3]|uniref:copper resistance CopC family protein n=1 Tax=Actinoplanes sp. TFC3 TaxID=1710355 RepID=UPI00083641AA|nr:copper resistance CopC family protein [Actinoplanes sp. TFC3]
MPAEARRRRLAAVTVAGVAVLMALVLARPGPQEPARLVAESPADGARLAHAPATVELTFSAAIDPAQAHLAVQDPDGRSAQVNPLIEGRIVRIPLRTAGDGTYRVGYHVALRGGQEFTGTTAFTVGAGLNPVAGGPNPVDLAGHDHLGSGPASAVLLVLGGLLAVLVLPLVFRRRVR